MKRILPPWDGLGGEDRVVLGAPPLALVVAQINFGAKYRIAQEEVSAAFQSEIEDEYPRSEAREIFGLDISAGPSGPVDAKNIPPKRLLIFSDLERNWSISLSTDHISLECRRYGTFDDLLDRMMKIARAFQKSFGRALVTRIGLRYINEIRGESLNDILPKLNPQLIGPLGNTSFEASLLSSMSTLQLATNGNLRMNLNHGYFPEGTVVQPLDGAVTDKRPFYLIDVDAFREFSSSKEISLDPRGLSEQLATAHDTLSAIFWWSIVHDYAESIKEEQ